jgi:hypothetical protein
MERPGPDPERVRETLEEERTEVEEAAGTDEPDVDELDEDPAYNPDDPDLKDIKGG